MLITLDQLKTSLQAMKNYVIGLVPTKVSELQNDSGYLTTETDPTVPSWAKAQTKPSYTADEVGAASVNIVADDYDSSSMYVVGDMVIYDGLLYQCICQIDSESWNPAHWRQVTVKQYVDNSQIDVQINGTSIANNGVANIPVAGVNTLGVAKVNQDYGIMLYNNILAISAPADIRIKTGGDLVAPIVAAKQHMSTFYGLAKAAGDTTQAQSDNAVGTYTADAKTAIKSMLGVAVDDVQVNGSSILNNGVANVPIASADNFGAVRIGSGIQIQTGNSLGKIAIHKAEEHLIKAGEESYKPIVPQRQHLATFYGLAKAAGVDMASSNNAVGTYTDAAKTAIKNMIGVPDTLGVGTAITASADLNSYTTSGIYSADSTVISSVTHAPTTTTPYKLIVESTGTNTIKQTVNTTNGGTYVRTGDSSSSSWVFSDWVKNISDVQINGTSILSNGVANIPKASINDLGVVKVNSNYGNMVLSNGDLVINAAGSTFIKAGSHSYYPLVPNKQHEAVFYGLAKAAGQDMASSNNAVGTYTEEAKTGIRTMLGAIGSTDYATQSTGGVVKIIENGSGGFKIDSGYLLIRPASTNQIKAASVSTLSPIVPGSQHSATFYGLATAAGDSTQSASDNAVGTYTDSAKIAIKTMIGIPTDSYDLGVGTSITASSDLNSYTTAGVYNADSSVISGITHAPTTTVPYKMIVESTGANTIKQTITTTDGSTYIRTGDSSTSSWVFSNWKMDISDVQINGSSILSNGVANIPIASQENLGVSKTYTANGISINNDGQLYIYKSDSAQIKAGNHYYRPVVPVHQHESVFYGLTKAAGVDMASSENAVGVYTDAAKTAIKSMLGVNEPLIITHQTGTYILDKTWQEIFDAVQERIVIVVAGDMNYGWQQAKVGSVYILENNSYAVLLEINNGGEALYITDSVNGYPEFDDDFLPVQDVQINGTSIVSNGVANVPYGSTSGAGAVYDGGSYGYFGVTISDGRLQTTKAEDNNIKTGTQVYRPIVPANQHRSTFYGLAKAAGADMASSDNAVGTYTDAAKSAIKTMIGVPDTTYDLNLGTSIATNADLDTYTTPGIYNADRTVTSSITHAPTTTTPYKLIVESTGTNTIRQTVKTIYGDTYVRAGDSSTSSWEFIEWKMNISDVQINGSSILSNGVANIPVAAYGVLGAVSVDSYYGTNVNSNGRLYVVGGGASQIKGGEQTYAPVTASNQHISTFYGLCKAAGVDMASSSNAVGTYTSEAKSAIQTMLGISSSTPEIFVGSTTPSGYTLYIDTENSLADGEEVSF